MPSKQVLSTQRYSIYTRRSKAEIAESFRRSECLPFLDNCIEAQLELCYLSATMVHQILLTLSPPPLGPSQTLGDVGRIERRKVQWLQYTYKLAQKMPKGAAPMSFTNSPSLTRSFGVILRPCIPLWRKCRTLEASQVLTSPHLCTPTLVWSASSSVLFLGGPGGVGMDTWWLMHCCIADEGLSLGYQYHTHQRKWQYVGKH